MKLFSPTDLLLKNKITKSFNTFIFVQPNITTAVTSKGFKNVVIKAPVFGPKYTMNTTYFISLGPNTEE